VIEAEKIKKLLGKTATSYSDSEIEQIKNTLIVLSDLAINSFLEKKEAGSEKIDFSNE